MIEPDANNIHVRGVKIARRGGGQNAHILENPFL
jgi:hypothetical protein